MSEMSEGGELHLAREELLDETTELTVFIAQSFQNMIPTLMEMIAAITEHLDDDDLTATIRGKLMASAVVQEQIRGEEE